MRLFCFPFLLSACWTQYDPIEVDQVPFQNSEAPSTTGIVTTYEVNLLCPDGEKARFYSVHNSSIEGPQPAAIVLHSSAFDYVVNPDEADPISGEHYAASYEKAHRLQQDWGVMKVWETLGMHPQIESTETNTGALPVALLNGGITAFYPINCWGDLWHNTESQPNDTALDLFPRSGGSFAAWMAQVIQNPEFAASEGLGFDFELSDGGLHLIGLGDGARGVVSLLKGDTPPSVAGILIDSPVDDLSFWAQDRAFSAEKAGLQRIFNYSSNAPDWNAWTLKALINQGYADGAKVGLAFSKADPRIPFPEKSLQNLIAAIDGHEEGLLLESTATAHVLLNSDLSAAESAVRFLLGQEEEPTPEISPTDEDAAP